MKNRSQSGDLSPRIGMKIKKKQYLKPPPSYYSILDSSNWVTIVDASEIPRSPVEVKVVEIPLFTLPETNSSPMKIPIEILVNTIKMVGFSMGELLVSGSRVPGFLATIQTVGFSSPGFRRTIQPQHDLHPRYGWSHVDRPLHE